MSIKQLLEKFEEFEDVQVLNQKELINELYKSKIEYRITYDANKDWFLIATAYNHTHEELLYDAAPVYGLDFNQMVDYYNDHYADLFDLIYTPKVEDIKLGFDHNNIAYIFDKFGTIYTKGQELSQNLLNDLTDRFGEANIKRLEESLHENLTKLEFNPKIQVADSIDSLVYFMKHNKGDYRIIIDNHAKLNIISSMDYVHYSAFELAVAEGWYEGYCKDTPEDINRYFYTYLNNLIFSDSDKYLGYDNNNRMYKYPFGNIYTKGSYEYFSDLPESLVEVIGEPISIQEETEDLEGGMPLDKWTKEAVLKRISKNKKELRQTVENMSITDIQRELLKESFGLYYLVLPKNKEQYIINVYGKNSVISENVSSWLAKTPTAGAKTIKIQEIQKEIKKLKDLKAELGKEISIISNNYFKKYHRRVPSEEWTPKDRKTQENNHKRQAEIDKQIEELKSDLKVVKDYFPPIQKKLFESNIYEDWLDDIDFGDISLDNLDLSIPEPEPSVKVDYTEHWVVLDKSVINDNFAKWWGNSYCCNRKGEPIVVYHSTNAEFDTFKSLDGSANGRPVYGGGFCFSAYEDYTKDFGKNTMACVLSIQNPLDLHKYPKLSLAKTYELVYRDGWEKYYNDPDHVSRGYLESKTEDITSCFQMLNKEGYSFKEIMDAYGYDGIIDGHVFIVVRPNQIKSINNKGTWSKTSDNIYESLNRRLERYL